MVEKEEIEAIWEKLKELEQAIKKLQESNLQVARQAAVYEISSAYHLIATVFLLLGTYGKPEQVSTMAKYMYPRSDSAQKAALDAPSIQEAFRIATDFHNDCMSYLKSHT